MGSVGGDLLLVSSSSGWGFKWVPITSPIFLWVQVGMLERERERDRNSSRWLCVRFVDPYNGQMYSDIKGLL